MDERLRNLLSALNGEALNLGLPMAATLVMLEANVDLILRYQEAINHVKATQQPTPKSAATARAPKAPAASPTA